MLIHRHPTFSAGDNSFPNEEEAPGQTPPLASNHNPLQSVSLGRAGLCAARGTRRSSGVRPHLRNLVMQSQNSGPTKNHAGLQVVPPPLFRANCRNLQNVDPAWRNDGTRSASGNDVSRCGAARRANHQSLRERFSAVSGQAAGRRHLAGAAQAVPVAA